MVWIRTMCYQLLVITIREIKSLTGVTDSKGAFAHAKISAKFLPKLHALQSTL